MKTILLWLAVMTLVATGCQSTTNTPQPPQASPDNVGGSAPIGAP